jgi:hypothetical protein
MDDEQMESYDTSTTLFVANHDGTDVYLIWPSDSGPITNESPCLALSTPDPYIACGGGDSLKSETANGPTYWLHPADQPVDESAWIALSENVSVAAE